MIYNTRGGNANHCTTDTGRVNVHILHLLCVQVVNTISSIQHILISICEHELSWQRRSCAEVRMHIHSYRFHTQNKLRKGDMIRSKTVKGMNALTTVTPLSGVSSLKSRQTNTVTVLVFSARGFR
jgi:hypothetical protein